MKLEKQVSTFTTSWQKPPRKPSSWCRKRSSIVRRSSRSSKARERETHKRDVAGHFFVPKRQRLTLKPSPKGFLLGKISADHLPSRSDDTVPVARAALSTFLLRYHARRNLFPKRGGHCVRTSANWTDVLLNEKPSQANLSDGRSTKSDSTLAKKVHGCHT